MKQHASPVFPNSVTLVTSSPSLELKELHQSFVLVLCQGSEKRNLEFTYLKI